MHSERRTGGSLQATFLFGLSALLIAFCIVYAPSEAFQASGQGLAIWWRIVFPALLPFLVLSEILLASGFAHGVGVLLEPLTRRYLGLPGPFAWVLPLGLTAGFPAAAQAAATLHKQGKISAKEAERMAGAAHFASPMLLVVVIGTGFMGREELGLLLLAIHWISGIASGVTMHLLASSPRSRRRLSENQQPSLDPKKPAQSRFRKAAIHMEEARREDGRSFGKLLGDAVSSSVQTLMTTGGYMLIFAVLVHVLASVLPGWIPSFSLSGLLEVHLGSHAAAQIQAPPAILCALIGAILGWSGMCAYLQVRSQLKPAGIGTRAFVLYRLVHGAYAYVFTLLLWRPLSGWLPGILPASAVADLSSTAADKSAGLLPDWKTIAETVQFQFWLMLFLCAASLGLSLFRTARKTR